MEFIVNYDIQIFNSVDELSEYFAVFLKDKVNSADRKFSIALSGGNTPKHIFQFLAQNYKTKIYWDKINFFWGDERCVPPIDDESNYKLAYDNLLSKISVPGKNIFRIKGEDDPEIEAKRYSSVIQKNLSHQNNFPAFDLIILGLGEDGHTASIFPDQINLINDKKICSIAVHPFTKQKRITLTGKTINNAYNIIFIVTGKNKSKIINDILNNKIESNKYPASFIKPLNGKLIWLLDNEAASLLRGN